MRLGEPNKKISLLKRFLPFVFVVVIVFSLLAPNVAYADHSWWHNIFELITKGKGTPFEAGIDKANEALVNTGGDILKGPVAAGFNSIMAALAWVIWKASGIMLGVTGALLNQVLMVTVMDMGQRISNVTAIKTAWTAFRDLSNIFLVFILLYIGINTILKGSSFNTKRLLGQTIVVALFINFSYLLTSVIIDTANLITLVINSAIDAKPTADGAKGIANAFSDAVKIQAIDNPDFLKGFDSVFVATVLFLVYAVVSIVFVFVSLLFIARFIILIILLITSPVAFVASIADNTKGTTKQWWNTLLNQAFFAPAAFLFFWVSILMLNDKNFLIAEGRRWTSLFTAEGFTDGATLVLNLIIVLGLLIGGIIMSRKIAGGVSGGAQKLTSFVSKTAGGAIIGGGAWAGRKGIGGVSNRIAENEFVKNRMPLVSKSFKGVAKKSFDPRNTKSFNKLATSMMGSDVGKGGKGKSYLKDREEKEKKYNKDEAEKMKRMSDKPYESLIGKKREKIVDETGKERDMTYAEHYAWKKKEGGVANTIKNDFKNVAGGIGRTVDKVPVLGKVATVGTGMVAGAVGAVLSPLFEDLPFFRKTKTYDKIHKTVIEEPGEKGRKILGEREDKTNEKTRVEQNISTEQGKLDNTRQQIKDQEDIINSAFADRGAKNAAQQKLQTLRQEEVDFVDNIKDLNDNLKTVNDELADVLRKMVSGKKVSLADKLKQVYDSDEEEKKKKEKKQSDMEDEIDKLKKKLNEQS